MRIMLSRALVVVTGVMGATAALADCAADANNLVTNCGFNANANNWSAAQGSCTQTGADGSSLAGSYECNSASDGFGGQRVVITHTCLSVGVVGGSTYGFGFHAKLAVGNGTTSAVNCTLFVNDFSDATCTTDVGAGAQTSVVSLNTAAPTAFIQNPTASLSSNASTQSISLQVTCAQSSPSSAYTVRMDDFFIGVGSTPVELLRLDVN